MLLKIYINYSHSKERTTNRGDGTYVIMWGRFPLNFGCYIILLIRGDGVGVRLPPKNSIVSTKIFDIPVPLRHNISLVQLLAMSVALLQKKVQKGGGCEYCDSKCLKKIYKICINFKNVLKYGIVPSLHAVATNCFFLN